MNKNQKFLLFFIGFCMMVIVGLVAFNVLMPKTEITPEEIRVRQRSVQEEVTDTSQTEPTTVEKTENIENII